MHLLFFQNKNAELLRWFTMESFCREAFVDALARKCWGNDEITGLLLPQEWSSPETADALQSKIFSYFSDQWRIPQSFKERPIESVFLYSADTVFETEGNKIRELFETVVADILTVQINPALSGLSEVARLTPENHIVGFRRLYEASMEPVCRPKTWPSMIYFREEAWEKILSYGAVNLDFSQFSNWLEQEGIRAEHFEIGGCRYQLDRISSFLTFFEENVPNDFKATVHRNGKTVIEPVWFGKDVKIDSGAVIIGPAILSDRVTVESDAVIRHSVVGRAVTIPKGRQVNQSVCLGDFPDDVKKEPTACLITKPARTVLRYDKFRRWSFFSYARLGKRLFDILISVMILILLIPLFPVFIVLVKWKSPGPVFYRARRQGLCGKEFDCLKFRSMMIQADQMQHQLQVLNQVDGPQFKIEKDPRVSKTGQFLRNTCIDELPQFINVLLGHMSVVGPRPSPESENESCPMWRDARLSVRPGITGPWQIFRTREASLDFQEWIYYDTNYVRTLSFKKDVWICLKTAQKLINNLLDQFG